jgi:phage recombination protein Bet
MTEITTITADINRQLADPKVANALLENTFKNFSVDNMKKAIMEGVIRGFTFKDFLEKKVYAIKYGEGYSLVTSIDHNRVIGMRSGVVGISAPTFTMTEEKTVSGIPKPEACSITVKKKVGSTIGEFTAEVYFDEYYKAGKTYDGKYTPSMWDQKPRTMLAKVAEMHALRKACPEELAQAYVEEEMQKELIPLPEAEFDIAPHMLRFDEVQTLEDLQVIWASLPIQAKNNSEILARKNELKAKLTPPPPPPADPVPSVDPTSPEGFIG